MSAKDTIIYNALFVVVVLFLVLTVTGVLHAPVH